MVQKATFDNTSVTPGWRADQPYNLKALVSIGVLREQAFGKEKLFVHPKLMTLLTRDSNAFEPYRKGTHG